MKLSRLLEKYNREICLILCNIVAFSKMTKANQTMVENDLPRFAEIQ